jgi:hypothetical protein
MCTIIDINKNEFLQKPSYFSTYLCVMHADSLAEMSSGCSWFV